VGTAAALVSTFGCASAASVPTTASSTLLQTSVPPISPAPAPESTPSPTVTTPGPTYVGGLSVRMPAALRYHVDGFTSTAESTSGFWANVPLGSACSPSAGCGLAVLGPFPPNAIVIGWSSTSGFGIGGRQPTDPTPNLTVGGRRAVYTSERPGTCGGDETITVRVLAPNASGNGDAVLQACLTGPDLVTGEAMIRSMLDSVQFTA
jgi:hypothetical protein